MILGGCVQWGGQPPTIKIFALRTTIGKGRILVANTLPKVDEKRIKLNR
jgi:hypothetical protein